MELKEILSKCDHTLLSQTATWEEIRGLCGGQAAHLHGHRLPQRL